MWDEVQVASEGCSTDTLCTTGKQLLHMLEVQFTWVLLKNALVFQPNMMMWQSNEDGDDLDRMDCLQSI